MNYLGYTAEAKNLATFIFVIYSAISLVFMSKLANHKYINMERLKVGKYTRRTSMASNRHPLAASLSPIRLTDGPSRIHSLRPCQGGWELVSNACSPVLSRKLFKSEEEVYSHLGLTAGPCP